MSKDKLQVCVSFKNTEEERELYMYVLEQTDKSVFIKNLIRQSRNGVTNTDFEFTPPKKKEKQAKITHGKKTRNKFLA